MLQEECSPPGVCDILNIISAYSGSLCRAALALLMPTFFTVDQWSSMTPCPARTQIVGEWSRLLQSFSQVVQPSLDCFTHKQTFTSVVLSLTSHSTDNEYRWVSKRMTMSCSRARSFQVLRTLQTRVAAT